MKNIKSYLFTLGYWIVPCLFFNLIFWCSFGIKGICFSLDTMGFSLGNMLVACLCFFECYLAIHYFIKVYGVYINIKRVEKFNSYICSLKCSFGVFGEQGVGKSLTMVYMIMILQPKRFYDLQYEVYKDMPIRERLLQNCKNYGALFPWKLYKTKEESLKFYLDNIKEKLPCVYAFKEQKIEFENRSSYDLKKEHFTMDKRLPENNLLACDEFGDIFNNSARHKSTSGKKTEEELIAIQETENTFKFASTHRQVSNGFMVLADQRKGDISLAFKGTCCKKWYLLNMNKMYKPSLIIRIYEFIKSKIVLYGNYIRSLEKGLIEELPKKMVKYKNFDIESYKNKYNQKLLQLHKVDKILSKIVNSIGFYKISYYEENGSEEVASLNKKDICYYSIPCYFEFNYMSRGYLLTNETIDKQLSI